MNASGEAAVHIEASPEAVYALVSDVTRMGDWSPETYRCQWAGSATGPAVGARFRAWNRSGWLRWSNSPEVLVAEPGREFAFVRRALGSEVVWRYRMEPDGSGTRLIESYEEVKPLPSVVQELVRRMMRSSDRQAELAEGMRHTLERIKVTAEAAKADRP